MEGLSFGQAAGLKDDLDVEENDVGGKKRQAFLDLLMEAGQNGSVLTETEVKEQVDTIMFEASITKFVITYFKRISYINDDFFLRDTTRQRLHPASSYQ